MNKVPFDVLEVGCKYESRCGEVWEVFREDREDENPYCFGARRTGSRSSWFTEEGRYINDRELRDDLIFKLVETSYSQVEEQSKHEMEDKTLPT